jgi:hypothetical protein
LPYNSTGQIFVAFEKPEHVPAIGKILNLLKFTVKEVNVMFHVYNLLPISNINHIILCFPMISVSYELAHLKTLSAISNILILPPLFL